MKNVCVTIDCEFPDHPWYDPTSIEKILATLEINDVTATFFIQGKWARVYPEMTTRIAAWGHQIGSHGWGHMPAEFLSTAGLEADIRQAAEEIQAACGMDPHPWYRPPYGRLPSGKIVNQLGYSTVLWDVDSRDYANEESAPQLVKRVAKEVMDRNNSIILFHSWPEVTASALSTFIRKAKESGKIQFGILGGRQTMEVVK